MSPRTVDRNLHGKPLVPRPRWPTRPYANKRGGPPSVTTVLNAMGKSDALPWAAAKETALFAVFHPDEWSDLAPAEAVERLRKHHRGLWDGRAAMGTLVHAVNEAWSWGEDVDIAQVVERILADKRPPQIWRGREADVVAEAQGYVDGLERFWFDYEPDTVATEEVVRYTGAGKSYEYVGQRDWTFRSPLLGDDICLADIKTTASPENPDEPHRYYLDSWRIQLAAYALANEVVTYDAEGNEDGVVANYPVQRTAVLHLRGDGDYRLVEVRAGAEEQGLFLRLMEVHRWLQSGHKEPPAIDRTIYRVMEGAVA